MVSAPRLRGPCWVECSLPLAAIVTSGRSWPDGAESMVGNVVIWSGEDHPNDTLIPRLILAGANRERIYFIGDIRDGNERRSFDPARDLEPLKRKMEDIGDVRLLIVDPIVSAIVGDSNKNAEVRRGLQPLVDLAAHMRCALLGITHFSKGTGGRDPVERLTGSLAFGAFARVVLVAAKYRTEGDDGLGKRLFCRAKSNIGPDEGGFHYTLDQAELDTDPGIFASAVHWGAGVRGQALELLARADATDEGGEGSALSDAKKFLSETLGTGPVASKTMMAEAKSLGHAEATIRRAKKALKVESFKMGEQWFSRLLGHEAANTLIATAANRRDMEHAQQAKDAQQNDMSAFDEGEHLVGDTSGDTHG
ncbi:MAG: AAA family ATPase [Pseudomonadales bacterium]